MKKKPPPGFKELMALLDSIEQVLLITMKKLPDDPDILKLRRRLAKDMRALAAAVQKRITAP